MGLKCRRRLTKQIWAKAERLIIVRQECSKRKKAVGKLIQSGVLYPEEYDVDQYRYSCYITDLDLPASIVWSSYREKSSNMILRWIASYSKTFGLQRQ